MSNLSLPKPIGQDAKAMVMSALRPQLPMTMIVVLQGVKLDMKLPPACPLMAQPPADHRRGVAVLLHYTWGSIFVDAKQNDTKVWQFDKRAYTAREHALQARYSVFHCISATLQNWGVVAAAMCLMHNCTMPKSAPIQSDPCVHSLVSHPHLCRHRASPSRSG